MDRDRCTLRPAYGGRVEVVEALVELGADKEAKDDDGARPLHAAADRGHVAVVKALAELGAYIEAAAADGFTPLHMAACQGHVDVVTTLVRGAGGGHWRFDSRCLPPSGWNDATAAWNPQRSPSCGAGAERGKGARAFRPHQKGGSGQAAHAGGPRPGGAYGGAGDRGGGARGGRYR
jgi:ankyrin repeat protein